MAGQPWLKYRDADEEPAANLDIKVPVTSKIDSEVQDTDDIGALEMMYKQSPDVWGAITDKAAAGYEALEKGAQSSFMETLNEQLIKGAVEGSGLNIPGGAGRYANMSPEEKAQAIAYQKQANETTPLKASMVAAGRETANLGRGVKNLADSVPLFGDEQAILDRNANWNKESEMFAPLEANYPIATGAGSMLPYFAMPAGGAIKGAQALTPNVLKQPTRYMFDLAKNMESRKSAEALKRSAINLRKLPKTLEKSRGADAVTLGTAVGAVHPDMTAGEGAFYAGAGYGLTKTLANRITRPTNYNKGERNLVQSRLQSRGYDLDPGVVTGDKFMQQKDQAFLRNPALAGPFRQAALKNQDLDNMTVSKLVGEPTTNLDGQWFARNRKLLSRKYDEIYDNLDATHTPAIRNETSQLLKRYEADFSNKKSLGASQGDPNVDPIVNTYTGKIWDMFGDDASQVSMTKWKTVNKQIEDRIEQYTKDTGKQHLVPYFKDMQGIMRKMLAGSNNKEFLGRLERNDLKKAVLEKASKHAEGGSIKMLNLADEIKQKYNVPFTEGNTGIKNVDDFYDSLKGAMYRNDAEGASLGVSDRISRLFRNPMGMNAGRFGYLLSAGGQNPGPVSSAAINLYRASPNLGLPTNVPGFLGSGAAKYSISDR